MQPRLITLALTLCLALTLSACTSTLARRIVTSPNQQFTLNLPDFSGPLDYLNCERFELPGADPDIQLSILQLIRPHPLNPRPSAFPPPPSVSNPVILLSCPKISPRVPVREL